MGERSPRPVENAWNSSSGGFSSRPALLPGLLDILILKRFNRDEA
jgi:hypothetical protein